MNFEAEFNSPMREETPPTWMLSIDGTFNVKGCDTWIFIERPANQLIKQSLKFKVNVSNNQAEYEVLIAHMNLALEVGASNLKANGDSQLVENRSQRIIKRTSPNSLGMRHMDISKRTNQSVDQAIIEIQGQS